MQEPLRALQMIASLYNGGSQAMIMNLYKNIDRNRIQFDFIVDHPEYDYYKETIEQLGGKIYTMPLFNGKNVKEVKKAWNDFFANHPEYRIFHSHARSYASIYLPIARKNNVKTIIHSHNTSNGKGISSIVKSIIQFPLRFQSDYYFSCSRDAGLWLFGKKVVESDRFFVLNNAIDARQFRYSKETRDQYRKEFGLDDQKVFIQVGSLSDQKNHRFTIEVFAKLCKEEPDCRLYIVGVGENKDDIEKQIKDNGLENNVFLLGRRSDVSGLLQMADCYIMPSIYEGLSVAAIEAQASGIHCFLSDVVSKDVCVTDVCEFLPLEEEAWVSALKGKFERKDTYQQIVDAGYDIHDTAKWLTDFYEGLIK